MLKTREILRLKNEVGLSLREIAQTCNCGKTTVSHCFTRLQNQENHLLSKKNITLMLLWEEYKEKHPDGIMYTQFCDRYRKFKKDNKISLHKEHKAGEEMEVDWAGDTITYVDTHTGELKPAYLFVAVLPASSYPFVYAYFVYAYGDTKIANWDICPCQGL